MFVLSVLHSPTLISQLGPGHLYSNMDPFFRSSLKFTLHFIPMRHPVVISTLFKDSKGNS